MVKGNIYRWKMRLYRILERGKAMYRSFLESIDIGGSLERLDEAIKIRNKLEGYLQLEDSNFSLERQERFYKSVGEIREHLDSLAGSENQKRPLHEMVDKYSKKFEAGKIAYLNRQIKAAQGEPEYSRDNLEMNDLEKILREQEGKLMN